MYPIAFVTTVQPWVTAWVVLIAFFLSMAGTALVSRGRSLRQVATMFVVGWCLLTVAVGVGTGFVAGLDFVTVEVVSVTPRSMVD